MEQNESEAIANIMADYLDIVALAVDAATMIGLLTPEQNNFVRQVNARFARAALEDVAANR